MTQYSSPPELSIDLDGNYGATLHTNLGDITLEFFAPEAPIAVNSFLFLAKDGFYDDVIFHRVVPGFVVQGGDPTGTGRGGPGYTFRDELGTGRSYSRGTLAMARTGVVDSATSQFFINLRDNEFLNHGTRDFGYAVFGRVSGGMDVVETIAAVETGNRGGHQDVPVEAVEIIEVTIDE